MDEKYIIAIDQSTQGTKALLFDKDGKLILRSDRSHEQKINEKGWVEHDPNEIYQNCIHVVKDLVQKSGIQKKDICGIGISNQRETALAWDKESQEPVYNAVVWQCARGEEICKKIADKGLDTMIKSHTGLPLSPYFSAAKIAWILENVKDAKKKAEQGTLCCGTIDSWLVYKLTGGKEFKTDYSNASRTQLFDIRSLSWDPLIAEAFGIDLSCLAQVVDSDDLYGWTDFEGYFEQKIPIHAVLGDSHGALFGQGCFEKGMIKATYGTGSSIMMNIGETPVFSDAGVVTSLAWGRGGKINYVLEGNINYTGAVIAWLEKNLQLIASAKEVETLARQANKEDKTYLVPAFTGLGAPYWDSEATGIICGITRNTGRAEIARAALDCIAYQITDIVTVMSEVSGIKLEELRVDGGPTKNQYLMEFQSDLLEIPVQVPEVEELSGIGVAYAAGIALGIYDCNDIFNKIKRTKFMPQLSLQIKNEKYAGWKDAVSKVLTK